MNTLTLFGVLFCLVGAYARHLEDINEPDPLSSDQNDGVRKHDQNRHRRRRWQMNYGYDYPIPPTHSYYPDNRRDYDRNQQDLLPQIVKLLEEISAYVKRPQPPPPPPQPIYIPYPIPYPVPQYTSCLDSGSKKPNVTFPNRFPEMEDPNQNWGFAASNEESIDDPNDGARPISFDPIKPIRPMKRPSPKVEHGSNQADSQQFSTPAPKFPDDQPAVLKTPSMCNAAILSCCADDKQAQKLCFIGFGCGVSWDNGNACSQESITNALESFKAAYSPVQ